MADPKKRAKLQSALTGVEEQPPKAEAPNLEDPKVQNDIMDPAGAELKLSYDTLRTYPLSVQMRRRAAGLVTRVLADSFGGGARNEEELGFRVASLLCSRADLEDSLFRIASVALHQPGKVSENDERVKPFIKAFQENCTSDDLLLLFSRISELSGFQANPKR